MRGALAIIIAVVLAVCCTGCGITKLIDNEETTVMTESSTVTNEIEEDSIEKNISVKTEIAEDGLIAVFITNNNKVTVSEIELEVLFYDSDKKVVDLGEDGHDVVLPGYTVVSRIEPPEDGYATLDTKITAEVDEDSSYENHSEEVDLKYNFGSDNVIIQMTNNSDVTIEELEYIVLLYKGDKLVTIDYEEDVYDLKPGKTATEKCLVYDDCDTAKVYLNQAHTFGL